MTNSCLRFAANGLVLALSAALVGCGPKDGSRERTAANAALSAGDSRKAAELYAKSLTYAPDNVDSLVNGARANLALGATAEATRLIANARVLAPTDADVLQVSAHVALAAGDKQLARKAFSTLAEGEDYSREVRSLGWTGLGIIDMIEARDAKAEGARDRARTNFFRAIRVNGKNESAYYHLGLLYRDYYDYKEMACEQFDVYVRLETKEGELTSKRVQNVRRNVLPELREAINAAVVSRAGAGARDSNACAAALQKADAAWKKGNFKTARLRYSDAYRADALNHAAALGLARSWAKTDLRKVGQVESYKYYRIACELNASAYKTFAEAGDMALKTGHYSAAVEIYSRALAIRPLNSAAVSGVIKAARKAGQAKVAAVYQNYLTFLSQKIKD